MNQGMTNINSVNFPAPDDENENEKVQLLPNKDKESPMKKDGGSYNYSI